MKALALLFVCTDALAHGSLGAGGHGPATKLDQVIFFIIVAVAILGFWAERDKRREDEKNKKK